MNLYSIPTLISFICTLGLLFFVLSQGRHQRTNKAFALAMGSINIMEFGNLMALNSIHPSQLLFWARISLIGCCLIPANWSLFSLVFAKSSYEIIAKKSKLILLVIYILSFSFLIFIPSDLFITLPASQLTEQNIIILGKVGRFFSFFLLLTIVFILINLETVYRNSIGAKRWQIKYCTLGIFAAFVFYVYVISRVMLFRFIDLNLLPIGSIVVVICSGFLAYSFIKHRLMNVNIFVSRQVFYGSFTIIAVSAYLILVGFVGELVKIMDLNFNIVFYPVFVLLSLTALLAFGLSSKHREKIKKFIDQHFYKNKFDYRFEWIELTNRISSVVDLNDLLLKFMNLIAETMCVSKVLVWLYDDDDKKFHLAGSRHLPGPDMAINKNNPLITYLKDKSEPFSIVKISSADHKEGFYTNNKSFLDTYKISTLSPLMGKDKLIGFLGLGEEVTGATYNYEDYDILKTMCHQAASVIMNIQLSERLILTREMEVMNKISSFVLHDLKNSISMLSLIVQNASCNMDNPEFQKDVLETIAKTIGNMKGLMGSVSRLPKEIVLHKTKTNLSELVEGCIRKTGLDNAVLEVTKNYADLPEMNLDRKKIQSVINNLILNARESMKDKGRIWISTLSGNREIIVEVKDDGPGMSKEFLNNKLFKPFQTTKKKGLGIGLYQCKIIIAAHDGKIVAKSEEGKGAQFRIYLPVE